MENEKVKSTKPQPSVVAKKQSTTEIPLVGLDRAITFITTIYQKALETAPMPQVAKGVGYEAATSTPFYRQVLAARLFGFMETGGAHLTKRASDYLKPHEEGAKARVLRDAVMGVPYYKTLIEKYRSRKLNAELVQNGIEKDFNLAMPIAMLAAGAFVSSVQMAGLSLDNVVCGNDEPVQGKETSDPVVAVVSEAVKVPPGVPKVFTDQDERSFYLSKDRTRQVTLSCPLFLTKAEYDRICAWIKVTWIIEDENSIVTHQDEKDKPQ
jgi:hypothetical protein